MRQKLKERRLQKKYTHKTIAKELGVSRSTYTNIENGNKNPSLEVAMKIKKILGYKDDDIFLNSKFLKETKEVAS
ncbi:helix-turn-helix transcriptional regulator [Clostridium sp. WILCCON 0269]|uniref:Helix-turn-helix transcriptional regulator n=1 Tax=Candidatus Clostridium eludens TaxID=3381663 RepID=A0ABW8SPU8_9CLOT